MATERDIQKYGVLVIGDRVVNIWTTLTGFDCIVGVPKEKFQKIDVSSRVFEADLEKNPHGDEARGTPFDCENLSE